MADSPQEQLLLKLENPISLTRLMEALRIQPEKVDEFLATVYDCEAQGLISANLVNEDTEERDLILRLTPLGMAYIRALKLRRKLD